MEADKLKDLREKSIPRLLLGYSLTTFAALLLNSIYTLTDAIFIGRGIGAEALGGITAVLPFTIFQSAISLAIGGGAAILVSQLLGKGEKKRAGETFLLAAVTFWFTAIIITILGLIFIDPLIDLLGAADGLKGYAKQYLTILLIGNVFSTGFSSVMRAEGKMFASTLQWVIPISVNIILDAVFIFGLKMGVAGAAWATVACQITSVITSFTFFAKFSSLEFRGAKLKNAKLKDIFSAGLPSLVQNGSIAVGMALLNNVFKAVSGGEMQVIYGLISKIFMFFIVPFTAVTQALQPIAGYNYGANRTEKIKTAIKYTVLFSLIASLVALLICEAAPKPMLKILTDDSGLIESGSYALRWISAAFPLMFLPSAVGVLLQSTGKKLAASLLFAENYIFIPPLAFLLVKLSGVNAVWISFPVAGALASVIAVIVLIIWLKSSNSSQRIVPLSK
ncbi:MAG: MATE family efflux transporter [Christensenellaceae bacterium]|jgi:putative MATE family efflux protein|nr:MATE family efflux transporter [Christensenellaceae bacterium]